jgi:hypothetical protein
MRSPIRIPSTRSSALRWAGALPALCSAFAFGAAARVALADHYHVYCNAGGAAGHGFVHGNSTTDNVWHARIELGCGRTLKHCEGGSTGWGSKGYTESLESTCERQVYGSTFHPRDRECWGWTYLWQISRIQDHYHYAHNRCSDV